MDEPYAWFTDGHKTDQSATTYDIQVAHRWIQKGWPVTPMYIVKPYYKVAVDISLTKIIQIVLVSMLLLALIFLYSLR